MSLRSLLPESITAFAARVHETAALAKQRRRLVRIAAYRHPPADAAGLLDAVRRKNLVFTVTAGRTGTVYLQRLLGLLPGTTSLHEPDPAFVAVLRSVQHAPDLARDFLLEYKLPAIAAFATPHYAEVSHLFCKGFCEPMVQLGILPRIVLLRRAPRPIALSLLARQAVPGRTKDGLKYLVQPSDPGVLPLPAWTRRSAYQLCFWYALEIERRQQVYGQQLTARGGTCVDVTADELHDAACFLDLATRLGILDPSAPLDTIRRRHREVSASRTIPIATPSGRSPGGRPTALAAEEKAVWTAVTPSAPDLRARVEARYVGP